MKIAYITTLNPHNKHSWSGTNYYTLKSLEKQGHSVYCIYNVHSASLWQKIKAKVLKVFGFIWLPERTIKFSKEYAKKIKPLLQPNTDVILSLGTMPVAHLKTDIPIYIYVDDIFEHFRTYYGMGNLTRSCIDEANIVEQRAIDNCCKIISCSNVTGAAILDHYKLDKTKLEIVPLGANIDVYPTKEEVDNYIASRERNKCKILFVGVESKRKGFDIVLDTAKILSDRKFPVEVHICGLRDLPSNLPKYVINHGFVNKSTQEGLDVLNELYSTSHFLFVPSRAESYGLVFCEASAFALPSISHKTGGVMTIVKDGVNGQLFDIGTSPNVFAEYIMQQFNDYESYICLAKSSYNRFCQELNWGVAAQRLTAVMQR